MDSSFETSGLPISAKLGFLSSKVLNRGKTLFLAEDAKADPFFFIFAGLWQIIRQETLIIILMLRVAQ